MADLAEYGPMTPLLENGASGSDADKLKKEILLQESGCSKEHHIDCRQELGHIFNHGDALKCLPTFVIILRLNE